MNKIILIVILLLTGCGLITYNTSAIINGEQKVRIQSNIPAKVSVGEVEVDQRSSGSWWEKILPQKVNIEK